MWLEGGGRSFLIGPRCLRGAVRLEQSEDNRLGPQMLTASVGTWTKEKALVQLRAEGPIGHEAIQSPRRQHASLAWQLDCSGINLIGLKLLLPAESGRLPTVPNRDGERFQ